MIPGQLTIDEAPTARASDPDTSHQAGARASLTAGQGRAAALNALAHTDALGAGLMARACGLRWDSGDGHVHRCGLTTWHAHPSHECSACPATLPRSARSVPVPPEKAAR